MKHPETFVDIPGRESFLDSSEAVYLINSLPVKIRQKFVRYYLEYPSDELPEMSDVMEYFTANSEIFSLFRKNSGNALAFEYLYHRQVSTQVDKYFIDCKAGFQIYQRLCSLEKNLPEWIMPLLSQDRVLKIDNIGSGTGRDMIRVLQASPDFGGRVMVRNIDPDNASLEVSRKISEEAGVTQSFSYHDL